MFGKDGGMTNKQKLLYETPAQLKEVLEKALLGKKFCLDCGHHVTFGHFLGNDIYIRNGKKLEIVCSQCSY